MWWPSRTRGTWTPARAWSRFVWVCPCLWLVWPTTLTVGTPSTLLVTSVPGCSPWPRGGATLRLRKFTSRDWNSFYIVLTDHLHCTSFHFYEEKYRFWIFICWTIVMSFKLNTCQQHWIIIQNNEYFSLSAFFIDIVIMATSGYRSLGPTWGLSLGVCSTFCLWDSTGRRYTRSAVIYS